MTAREMSADTYHSPRFRPAAGEVTRSIIRTVRDAGPGGLTRKEILLSLRMQGWERLEYGSVTGRVRDELDKDKRSQLFELGASRKNETGFNGGLIVHVDYAPWHQLEMPA